VEYVVVKILGTHDDVAEDPAAVRNFGAKSGIQSCSRGHRVDGKTDSTETACDITGVPGIPSCEKCFEATGHSSAAPGVFYLTVLDLHLDLEVSLDPGYRINSDSLAH